MAPCAGAAYRSLILILTIGALIRFGEAKCPSTCQCPTPYKVNTYLFVTLFFATFQTRDRLQARCNCAAGRKQVPLDLNENITQLVLANCLFPGLNAKQVHLRVDTNKNAISIQFSHFKQLEELVIIKASIGSVAPYTFSGLLQLKVRGGE